MSICKKDLKLPQLKPQLAIHYEGAMRKIYGKSVWVGIKNYPKFAKRGRELDKKGIYMRDYSFGLATALTPWIKNCNMSYIPHNIFLGEWAENYYNTSLGNLQFNYLTDDREQFLMLVAEEYVLVEYMVHHNSTECMSISNAVEDVWDLMSDVWKQLWKNGGREAIVIAAFEQYTETYGSIFTNYQDLI